ncbi:MAG: RsmB/NOP family class I SAM-dependent RNA methyltransferase [Deltaproteobacteria bacterium]|nr:RsmB/NOP family class I SAM-dependent RNA methyltransferase [Deltaproteobacteria bacterium]
MTFSPNEARMRQVLLDLWSQTRADWRFVTERLAQAFRDARQLHSAERRQVAETIHGLVRRARTIDHALAAVGIAPPAPGAGEITRARAHVDLVAYRVLFEGLPLTAALADRPDVDWAAVQLAYAEIDKIAEPERRFALRHSFPDWLAAAIMAELGPEADAFAEALNQRAPLTIRANRIKTSRDTLIGKLAEEGVTAEPTRWSTHGLNLVTRVNVFGLAAFKAGLFEVQDEASQLVTELVQPSTGTSLVVDACAGAGGKTLALGALMHNKGRLVAMDTAHHKLEELGRRARRAGLSNHRWMVVPDDGPLPAEADKLVGKADRVLVDAPCSGVGSMRRNPEARWRLAPDFVAALPDLQHRIALRALPLVAPGGRLVYATCTTLARENEAVVARLLEAAGEGWERVAPKEILGRARVDGITTDDGWALRTWPHKHGMDGFFAAVIRRKAPG